MIDHRGAPRAERRNAGHPQQVEDDGDLTGRWLQLTRETLPARARAELWHLRADHCFMRVLLDAVHGRRWDEVVQARPAYRNLAPGRLAAAVRLAQRLAEEPDALQLLEKLDDESLAYRGKSRRRPGR